jgi:signal peptidase I
MAWKSNKWIGALLSLFLPQLGLGLFYVGAPRLALAATAMFVSVGAVLMVNGWADFYVRFAVVFMLVSAVLTFWLAVRSAPSDTRAWYSKWHGLAAIGAAYVLIALLFRAFAYEPFKAPSTSMEPRLPSGSLIVVQKWGYGHYTAFGFGLARGSVTSPLARGDVVVFEYPKDRTESYIKRLIGLPGDVIVLRGSRLSVNGVEAARRSLGNASMQDLGTQFERFQETSAGVTYDILQRADSYPYPYEQGAWPRDGCSVDLAVMRCTVPVGHYFVMGDNRDNSHDSRMFGFVPATHVIGKVIGRDT